MLTGVAKWKGGEVGACAGRWANCLTAEQLSDINIPCRPHSVSQTFLILCHLHGGRTTDATLAESSHTAAILPRSHGAEIRHLLLLSMALGNSAG